jgi:hypothetical protein
MLRHASRGDVLGDVQGFLLGFLEIFLEIFTVTQNLAKKNCTQRQSNVRHVLL